MTTTTTTATTTTIQEEALDFALLVHPSDDNAEKKDDNAFDAANLIRTAELRLLHALDFPDQSTRIFGSFHSTARLFPLFYEAYAKATNSSLSALYEERYEKKLQQPAFTRVSRDMLQLSLMTQAERHALKLVLHEDIKAIALAALEEATKTPKKFDGVPLPTEPTECLQSVNALIQATEQRLFALRVARTNLKRMEANAMASARVLGHDDIIIIEDDNKEKATTTNITTTLSFTKLPPPTTYEMEVMEEEEEKAEKHKRAKISEM